MFKIEKTIHTATSDAAREVARIMEEVSTKGIIEVVAQGKGYYTVTTKMSKKCWRKAFEQIEKVDGVFGFYIIP